MREKTGEFRAVLSSLVFTWLAHQVWQPCGLSPEGADHRHTSPTVRTGHDPPVWSLHVRNCHNCGAGGWSSKALLSLYLFSRPCKLPTST